MEQEILLMFFQIPIHLIKLLIYRIKRVFSTVINNFYLVILLMTNIFYGTVKSLHKYLIYEFELI